MKFKIKGKEFKYFIGEYSIRVTWENKSVLIFKELIDPYFDLLSHKEKLIKKYIKKNYEI